MSKRQQLHTAPAEPAALADRTAVVTGGGRGIGRATAVALAEAGVRRVLLLARTAQQLEEAAHEVRHAGAESLVMTGDLATTETLGELATDFIARLGQIDILINNAATVAPLGGTSDLAADDISQAFRLNCVAPMVLAGRLAPLMVSQSWGRIVNISSGIVANAAHAVGSSVYAATKSALEAHTVALAAELADSGVTVNAYRPGIVDTSMQEWVRDQDPAEIGSELHDRFMHSYRSGSLLTPRQSGEALVAHLARNATGQIWTVTD